MKMDGHRTGNITMEERQVLRAAGGAIRHCSPTPAIHLNCQATFAPDQHLGPAPVSNQARDASQMETMPFSECFECLEPGQRAIIVHDLTHDSRGVAA